MSQLEELFRFGKAVDVAVADSSVTTQVSEADTAAAYIRLTGSTPLTAVRAVRLAQRQNGAMWWVRNLYTFDVDVSCGPSAAYRVPAGAIVPIILEPT